MDYRKAVVRACLRRNDRKEPDATEDVTKEGLKMAGIQKDLVGWA